MRAALVVVGFLAVLPPPAWATWSVIAVDRSTGRVVIASATCVDRDDQFLMGVQAVVVPGKGVAACQAAVERHAREPDARLPGAAEGHGPGAHLTVSQPGPDKGPRQIAAGAGENLNPVKTLRTRYDAWRRAQPVSFR